MRKWFLLFFLLGLISCNENNSPIIENPNDSIPNVTEVLIKTDTIIVEDNIITPGIQHGFYGFIIEYKGDFMPGTEYPGTIDTVQMDLYIFNKLRLDSIQNARPDRASPLWLVNSIKQIPVAIIKTNNLGFYEFEIPNGEYTGLIRIDNEHFYANGFDGLGYITPMIKNDDALIKINFSVDYEMDV
ncbi:MAG: hypothetical protein JXA77_09475 [Bacteroidales bacterium]|nr:hypothetical protein [Bacteroidales bacterium]MBN2817399.1 hypothetical protein [Bacteroidales bacterium]